MAIRPMSSVLRFLRLIVSRGEGGELTDGHFLQAFVERGDEGAFQSLVQRHGAMVLGVCRRVLRQDQDAEDAFQATFLVLARKAGSIAAHGSLGNWLYGVAYRTAMKARVAQARRCKREAQAATMIEERPVSNENWGDLQPLLDRELERLPAKLRSPLVLCGLESKTRAEAAQILGWPEGTLSWRLASARSLLARRLQRLGVTLPAAGLGLISVQSAAAAVPPKLIVATVQAACVSSLGQAVAADGKGIDDLGFFFFERRAAAEFKYKLAGADKIDFMTGDDKKEAIWKVEGDSLTIAMPIKPGLKRPTEFKADKDTAVFALERAKPLTPEEISQRKVLVEKLREKAAQAQSANNLKQIALAMHHHHDAYNSLPAGAIYSKDGKTPLLSWRVAILPFIEQVELYKEFKLDEPWDSEHNKKLIPKMPQVYAFPLAPEKVSKEGKTYYQVFTGPGTVFVGNEKMRLLQIADGTSNTILVVEAKDPVIWTRPEDLTLPKDKAKIPPLGGHFKNGFNVAWADGSVQLFRPDPPAVTMRLLIDPNDGNAVDIEKLTQTEK